MIYENSLTATALIIYLVEEYNPSNLINVQPDIGI